MLTFAFFVLLTVVVAFLMNWLFGKFFSECKCDQAARARKETERLGASTEEQDVSAFLG